MTDGELSVPAWAVLATLAVLVLVVVGLAAALVRSRARTRVALAEARTEAARLAEQVAAIEQRLDRTARSAPKVDEHEYVVTMLGRHDADEPDVEPAPVVPGPLFADLVLRESAVQAASLASGLRRALAPETRHRIRWEMRREVKRARKQRRSDLRQAKREFDDRQRAGVDQGEDAA